MVEDVCIFCELGKGNSRTIFEDKHCYVIPDRFPSQKGHLLVIAKDHHESILTAPNKLVEHMAIVAKKFAIQSKKKHKSEGIVITTNAGKAAGQLIMHYHIHVIPIPLNVPKGFIPHRELTEPEAQILKRLLKS
jgi:histidine triad (HIT) family protein